MTAETTPEGDDPSLEGVADLVEKEISSERVAVAKSRSGAPKEVPSDLPELPSFESLSEPPKRTSSAPPEAPKPSSRPGTPTGSRSPSIPPAARTPSVPPAPTTRTSRPPPRRTSTPPSTEVPEALSPELPPPPPPPLPPVEARDLADVELLVSQGQWGKVAERLGPLDRAEAAGPRVTFLYTLASKESLPAGVDWNEGDAIARRALAGLLGVDETGVLVRILCTRIFRRSWRSVPAPPTRTSVLLVIAAIMVGAFIGFLLGPGKDWFRQ
jgi:hypothetical protein